MSHGPSASGGATLKPAARGHHDEPYEPVFVGATRTKLDELVTRYPTKQAALLPALHLAQEEFGWISDEVMLYVADQLGIPPIEVMETATWYTMYHKTPPGKHCVSICVNVSCFLNGADNLLSHVEGKLGVKAGHTTADGKISLFAVECLANCDKAPCAQVNDDYQDLLTREAMDKIIDGLAKGA